MNKRMNVIEGLAFVVLLLVPLSTKAGPTLRQLAAERGILFGTAVKASALASDDKYREVLVREFALVTPENELKWAATHPAEGRFDFSKADQIVDFAAAHGLQIRGHTLCWNADRYLPKWMLSREFTREQVEALLHEHIRTVMQRYRGRIKCWDVVNEAVANDNRPDAAPLFDGFWMKHLGEDYIALAFRFAHEADPEALLFYNDYDHGDALGPKSDRIYALLKRLIAAGVPVHGVGLQMHCNLRKPPVGKAVRANFERLAKLGLQVQITELDVDPSGVSGTMEERLQKQADVYRDIVSAAVSSRVCKAILTWGFSDRFIQKDLNRRQGLPENTPTLLWLFDAGYHPKPAFEAVLSALQTGH